MKFLIKGSVPPNSLNPPAIPPEIKTVSMEAVRSSFSHSTEGT
jgi:hypothetical protein